MGARATLLGATRSGKQWLEPLKKPIRIGVVGLGPRSRYNAIPSLIKYDEYELVAICDIIPQLVKEISTEIKDKYESEVNCYTDYSVMLKSENLDAMCIQVDVDKQIDLACQAMEADLDVMVEVPLTYTIEDCWKIVIATERSGKVFFMMEQIRYSGYVEAYREIVQSGVMGKPVFVEGEYFHYLDGYFFQGDDGKWFSNDDFGKDPDAKPTWRYNESPLVYLPHDLSPLLYILDDRVSRVVGMGNKKQSSKFPAMKYRDVEVALMYTEKDVVMRMATGFNTVNITRANGGHWQHIKCADGIIEGPRTKDDKHKLYIPKWQMKEPMDMEWTRTRTNASKEALASGHGGTDYYVFAVFADKILHDAPLIFDVYRAVETSAPAILAAKSIENANVAIDVPDFRPNANRKAGEMPS